MAWRLIAARGAIASAGGPWPKSIEGTLGIFCVADARRRATNALFGLDADLRALIRHENIGILDAEGEGCHRGGGFRAPPLT